MSSNKAMIGILSLVFVFFITLILFAYIAMQSIQGDSVAKVNDSSKSIAVVEVSGVIMTSKKIINLLHRAEKDKKIKAIIIRINSPGGAVAPVQEVYDEMLRINKNIPIYASFATVAASGGYYIGSAARKIYANRGTLTGSIGVIMQFLNLSELYKLAKISPETIKAGKYKDIGQPNRSMTDEEKVLMNSMIGKVHQQFKDDILATRKDKLKKSIDEVAQGQIFSGQEAYELGLVDKLSSLWNAAREIHNELKLEGEFQGVKFIKEKKKFSFMELADHLESAATKLLNLAAVSDGPVLMFK